MIKFPKDVVNLREAFVRHGFDLRLVGGGVRDYLLGIAPKDFDFCCDANPEEQISVYKSENIHYVPTGLQHGTISVVLGSGVYEITSLRTEDAFDGRHATVQYTKDWLADANRRDIRYNAMSMTFDGQLIDPFNGQEDLKNKLTRFVGNPDDRMKEDYLRILRWLRFHVRIAGNTHLDASTCEAARRCASGLKIISKERVWMEIGKILTYPECGIAMKAIYDLGLAEHIDLPNGDVSSLENIIPFTKNPVTRLFAILGSKILDMDWKWTREEISLAQFLVQNHGRKDWKRLLVWNAKREHVIELLCSNLMDSSEAENWEIPKFPVTGADALSKGLSGKAIGDFLESAKEKWFESDFELCKDDLL